MQEVINPNGIVLYAKQPGFTSFSSLFTIKHALKTKKVGHTGTLDSFAQGLLVVCCGSLTRLASYITSFNKEYEAIICFGQETDTLDPSGKIIQNTDYPSYSKLKESLNHFVGEQNQVPPMYSALHIDGKRLSDIARNGKSIEIPSRKINVFEVKLIDAQTEDLKPCTDDDKVKYAHVLFSVSKGTYIRALARDIAKDCNSSAYLVGLLRTKVGNFSLDKAACYENLTEFSIKSVLQNLKTDSDEIHISKEIEQKSEDQVKDNIIRMNKSLAVECGFSFMQIKSEYLSDFHNGKKLKKDMFVANCELENCEFANGDIAIFDENDNFHGLINKTNNLYKYCYVISNSELSGK